MFSGDTATTVTKRSHSRSIFASDLLPMHWVFSLVSGALPESGATRDAREARKERGCWQLSSHRRKQLRKTVLVTLRRVFLASTSRALQSQLVNLIGLAGLFKREVFAPQHQLTLSGLFIK